MLALLPVRQAVTSSTPGIGRNRNPVSRRGRLARMSPNPGAARAAANQTGWNVATSQSSRGWADRPV